MQKVQKIEFFFEIGRILVSLIIAFGLSLLCIAIISDSPGEAVTSFALGPFSGMRRFGQLIKKMIPYLFTGCGMCFIYASNRFSLVGEGVFTMSGCMTALVGLALAQTAIPHVPFVIVLIILGAAVGAAIGLIPAILREKLMVNEVVVAVMLNYALLYFSNWLVKTFMLDNQISYTASYLFDERMQLTELVPRTDIHTGLILGLIVVLIAVAIFFRTRLGNDIRLCGANPNFARMAGIGMTSSLIIAQVLGATLCGIGGAVEIMGVYDRYVWTALTNNGTDGLLVAVLAKKNPIFIPLGAFLLAYMRTGASVLNYTTTMPIEFVEIMQSLLILLIAAKELGSGIRNSMVYRLATQKEMGEK